MGKRNLAIDLIKIMAMFGVICLHSTHRFIVPGNFGLANILYESAVISIPLFFMVSGYLLLGRQNIDYKYSIGKICLIIKFVFLITFSFYVLSSLLNQSFNFYLGLKFFVGSFVQKDIFGVFWYLGAMIIIYSIYPLVNKLYKSNTTSFIILTIIVFFISTGFFLSNMVSKGETIICQTFRLWNWLFYFFLGGIIKMRSFPYMNIYFSITVLLILFLTNITIQELLTPFLDKKYCEFFYGSPLVMVFAAFLFVYVLQRNIKFEKIIHFFSNLFLPVYTFHMFIIIYTTPYCINEYFITPLLYWIIVSIITVLLSAIIMKIPIVKNMFNL